MSAVGTLDWAERTGGRLSRADRVAILRQGVALQLRQLPSRVAARLGLSKPARIDLDSVRVPDSAAAREAEAATRDLPPFLAAHSHRTYLWGAMLAMHDGIAFDEESCYVACLLHDFGIGHPPGDSACFTTAGAARARELAQSVGWPESRGRAVAEGIVLHFNAYVPAGASVEGHLVNTGAVFDVMGGRRWEFDRATVDAVLERHPRQAMKEQIVTAVRRDAERAPDCRPAFMLRYGRLDLLVKRAPFRE